jgi:energy-coupling factor transport system ATP-binding protein
VKVSVEHVSFSYPGGVEALRDVSLTIEPGEAVAILGENGAGKSTLAKHLNGLLRPGAGRVLIGDWDTREHTAAQMAQRVGYVFQNPDDQLFERAVRKEVAFGPHNLGFPDAEVDRLVSEALDQVGLADRADAHPYDLPLFERKLLTLGAVLAMQTPIIIFDEPTTGQDARGMERIGRIIEDLRAEGRTVITISHDVDFCAEHFPRLCSCRARRSFWTGRLKRCCQTARSRAGCGGAAAGDAPGRRAGYGGGPSDRGRVRGCVDCGKGRVTLMAASKGHVVVLCDLIADLSMRISGFPVVAQDLQEVTYLELGPGGACNAAIVVARLGLPVLAMGEVGRDEFGQTVVEDCDEGIQVNYVRNPAARTPVAGVLVDPASEPAYLGYAGDLQIRTLPDAWRSPIRSAAALYADGWAEHEGVANVVLEGFRLAREAGVPVFFDPGPGNPRMPDGNAWHREAAALATVVLVNEAEAEALTGLRDAKAAARRLAPELAGRRL